MDETTKLQEWFTGQGMTATALANRLGLSLSYVSRLLAGERQITGDVKWRFANAYGHELADSLFSNGSDQH